MSWPFADRPSDAVKLGRSHAVPVEIHYSSGSDRYWYHGNLWTTETRPIRERQFNPWLQDPRNRAIVERIRKHPAESDAEVAEACSTPPPPDFPQSADWRVKPWTVREVRRAFEHADETHLLRLYGLEGASKEEERILVTIDQDLIKDAPMIPYTRTEKGARRFQMWMMLSVVLADVLVLYFMFQFITLAPSVTYASAQVASLGTQFVELMAMVFGCLGVYWFMARRTQVLDMELQPIVENLQDTHSEAVFLVNSEKAPVTTYVARIFRLGDDAIRTLCEEIGRFQADAISNLQEQNRSQRDEIDHAKILGVERYSSSADMDVLGRASGGGRAGTNLGTLVLIIGIVAVLAVALTYAAMAGGG
jgi:hypothetical protein